MHGQVRSVERRIRLWMAREEMNRQREGSPARSDTRAGVRAERRQRALDSRRRGTWR